MKKLRDFVKVSDGRIGLIVANDSGGGVFRGHYDLWFGKIKDGKPVVEQLCRQKDWELVERPLGEFDSTPDNQGHNNLDPDGNIESDY